MHFVSAVTTTLILYCGPCVMIFVETVCIGGKCSVVLCLKNRKYGGESSLTLLTQSINGRMLPAVENRQLSTWDSCRSRHVKVGYYII